MSHVKKWKLLHRIVQLESPWVTVYADRLQDNEGKELEYWHYLRPDSAVAIVMQGDDIVLPAPQYRVGVEEVMLDFAGTRIPKDVEPEVAALRVVVRELGIETDNIIDIRLLTPQPLAVDSSFSSQRLHGFVVRISPDVSMATNVRRYPLAQAQDLRHELRCGQCRLLLDEFLLG